ncbi:hypothetical protein Amsp01_012720 [Amycolatopsis sp. NBRC 101858]|uniref:hypothetical protein n=1 Tax=unclassified Amycolatopsis TaxID=2618356 RepID=UPI0024A36B38|nr:hypothetical protein [Amycolatopsis sp. NBRC 101858]GLY35248.1 hypothetical protein Amsp01_012720 [Amycolatopsis sp. NBRC 101858]
MTAINYPAVVHAPHFALESRTKKGMVPLSDRLYSSKEDAETWAMVLREPGERVFIAEYSVAYYARCVVCGEFSDHERWRTAEWTDLVEYLTHEPGWRCTSEQLVFCPNHRPDEED